MSTQPTGTIESFASDAVIGPYVTAVQQAKQNEAALRLAYERQPQDEPSWKAYLAARKATTAAIDALLEACR